MFVPLSVLCFRDHAAAYFRDKVGVIDGGRSFTYGEFAERTHRLANALRTLGVRKGDRVSFMRPFYLKGAPPASSRRRGAARVEGSSAQPAEA